MFRAHVAGVLRSLRSSATVVLALGLLPPWGCALAAIRVVPYAYPTIQVAIDNSASGDTVLIAPGTYSGDGNHDLDLGTRDLLVTSMAGAEQTIIDCQGRGRGFYVNGLRTQVVRIQNLTIVHGAAESEDGGAVYIEAAAAAITDCRLLQNSAGLGGGVCFKRSEGTVARCVIAGNEARWGAGIMGSLSVCAVSDCVITGNVAEVDGGGVISRLFWDGDALVLDCRSQGPDEPWTMSWRYELLEEGQSLRALERIRGGGRDQDNTWIFERR